MTLDGVAMALTLVGTAAMSFERASHRWCRALVTALALHCFASGALAQPAARNDVDGYVLSVEGTDVIIDVGSARGASVGDIVELWRPLDLVHPVSKQHIRDRYRIGRLKIVQVRERMAVAVSEDAKLEPATGDSVVLRRKLPEPPPATAPAPVAAPVPRPSAAATANATADEESEKVNALFESLREAPLVDRIRAYVAYVKKNPQSPFARVLHEDAVQFHRLLRAQRVEAESTSREEGPAMGSAPAVTRRAVSVAFEAPAHALAARELELGIHLAAPLTGAVLHVRSHGAVGYRSIAMAYAGSGHYRATIPADAMQPPKTEYFIEGVDREGRATPVVGTDDSPNFVEVERRPSAEPPTLQKRTTASVSTDWADFNRLRSDRMDRTWQTEGLVGMRFSDIGVRAVRTGFGVYRGVSGSLQELDDLTIVNPRFRNVGLTYGYLEGEFGLIHRASLIGRVVTGLTESGIAAGGLFMVRIGNDLETNLLLGAEILGGVGIRSITQLELYPLPRLPIVLRSEVTNQPAGVSNPRDAGSPEFRGDVGLRAIVQPGYEVLPGLVLAVRLSYQGRTIYHAGPGFGGAVSYSW